MGKAETVILGYAMDARQKKNLANKTLEELYMSEVDVDKPLYNVSQHLSSWSIAINVIV